MCHSKHWPSFFSPAVILHSTKASIGSTISLSAPTHLSTNQSLYPSTPPCLSAVQAAKKMKLWRSCMRCSRKVSSSQHLISLLRGAYSHRSDTSKSRHLKRAATEARHQKRYYRQATQILQDHERDVAVFPFLALPAEIRLEVYFELLVSDDRLVLTWRGPRKANKQQKRMYISILRTCKLCRDEGRGVLYGENVFDFGESPTRLI